MCRCVPRGLIRVKSVKRLPKLLGKSIHVAVKFGVSHSGRISTTATIAHDRGYQSVGVRGVVLIHGLQEPTNPAHEQIQRVVDISQRCADKRRRKRIDGVLDAGPQQSQQACNILDLIRNHVVKDVQAFDDCVVKRRKFLFHCLFKACNQIVLLLGQVFKAFPGHGCGGQPEGFQV